MMKLVSLALGALLPVLVLACATTMPMTEEEKSAAMARKQEMRTKFEADMKEDAKDGYKRISGWDSLHGGLIHEKIKFCAPADSSSARCRQMLSQVADPSRYFFCMHQGRAVVSVAAADKLDIEKKSKSVRICIWLDPDSMQRVSPQVSHYRTVRWGEGCPQPNLLNRNPACSGQALLNEGRHSDEVQSKKAMH